MKRYALSMTILLTLLMGCQFRDPLPALWFYTYGDSPAGKRDTALTPASFLQLRPDGTYTRDFGRFEYGRWQRQDKQLVLTSQQHIQSVLTLNGVTIKEMQLTTDKGVSSYFESLPLPPDRPEEDPFSLDNNQWRLPASHKESDAELHRRLFNHCRFWEAYFTWALKNSLSTIDVRSTPTLIKIYGNGFGLKPFEDLPATWRAYFFDVEDCQKANDIIESIFRQKNIAWAHTDNKFKMFIGAFQQLEQYLR